MPEETTKLTPEIEESIISLIGKFSEAEKTLRHGSSAPAYVPKNFFEQFFVYESGTVRRLYVYVNATWVLLTNDHGELGGLTDDDHNYLIDLVEDITPQLGGDLDLNGKNIDFPSTANISDCLDEDTMVSNSAVKLATQQSIKAYVDNKQPSFEMFGLFQDVTAFPDFDEAGADIAAGGLRLSSPSANRTVGKEIENRGPFYVFGNGKKVEFSCIVGIGPLASQRTHNVYIVVGDLTGGAVPTMTNNHFGFRIEITNTDGLGIEGTNANGTLQLITGGLGTIDYNEIILKAIYDGSSKVDFYVNETLAGTSVSRLPTTTAAGHFGTFIRQSPGTDDTGDTRTIIVKNFNYKVY